MSQGQPQPPHPVTLLFRGTVLKTRPFFQRLQNTPPVRFGIAVRWIAWLAHAWTPTATTILAILVDADGPDQTNGSSAS